MSALIVAIALVLNKAPIPDIDKNEENRDDRIQVIAMAIDNVSNGNIQTVAELIVQAEEESALASNVHRDECLSYQCDPAKLHGVIIHKARSLWQLHRAPAWSDVKWESLSGDSLFATTNAAREAAKLFLYGHIRCGSTAGAFALLATGHACTSKSAEQRAHKVERVKSELWNLTRSK